jgi:hypothetical protein
MILETNRVLEVLHDKLAERIDYLKDWASKGLATDYAEYKRVCGEIKGLKEACRAINETFLQELESDE